MKASPRLRLELGMVTMSLQGCDLATPMLPQLSWILLIESSDPTYTNLWSCL